MIKLAKPIEISWNGIENKIEYYEDGVLFNRKYIEEERASIAHVLHKMSERLFKARCGMPTELYNTVADVENDINDMAGELEANK